MHHLILLAALLTGGKPELLTPVNAWVNAFNSAQSAFPSDAFTDDCTVIDEFTPFAWSNGHEDVRTWYARLVGSRSAARRARFLSTHQHVTLGSPQFGRSKFVVTERRTTSGWRIAAHSWAINSDD